MASSAEGGGLSADLLSCSQQESLVAGCQRVHLLSGHHGFRIQCRIVLGLGRDSCKAGWLEHAAAMVEDMSPAPEQETCPGLELKMKFGQKPPCTDSE